MSWEPPYAVEPWAVRESELRLDALAQSESVFALSNGHLGMRGNLDEGDPSGMPGTYLNGFHETRPLPYAESAYGNPEAGETVLNVTDGKLLRLMVDDELFDVTYGELLEHERALDLRDGVLHRRVHWRSPAGPEVRITSTRLVSLAQRGVAAILYEVEPVTDGVRLVVQSELIANEDGQRQPSDDPRAAAHLRAPLIAEEHEVHGDAVMLAHRTDRSDLRLAAAMDHKVDGPEGTTVETEVAEHVGRVTIAANVRRGGRLRILKLLSYGWSGHRSLPSLRAQVRGALAEARHTGWAGLRAAQREILDDFWARADVEIDGDDELQLAVRFALFHIFQASLRAERRAIPAKGLTGSGYDGHAFWDSESYVLPVMSYTSPEAAADALRWRHSTLEIACERASQLGLEGAAFPWRTIAGRECSGYWPAGTAAFHVNADIADAVVRVQQVTGDEEFAREIGLPLLVETARLWRSLGHFDGKEHFRIPGVTGPDEYSALADDNVYTNLMAARNLRAAADAAQRFPDAARDFGVADEETRQWRRAAERMFIAYDVLLGVHQQASGFTHHARWDFENTPAEKYPLLLSAPYFDLYRKQVVKQADLVMALYVCGDCFDAEQKARDFAYYEGLTVRDSSLSAAIQAIVAAETGHVELAFDYLGETALIDLHDLAHNTRDGLHIASLAGCWLALVAGFGGMRDHGGRLTFAPRLPAAIERLVFRLTVRGARLRVEVRPEEATYTVEDGDTLEAVHEGERITVSAGAPQSRPLTPPPPRAAPQQPHGRAPRRRGVLA